MATWVMRMMFAGGYPAVVFLMFLENAFPPVPSELILPLAGYMTQRGQLTFAGVVLAATLGSFLGTLPFYVIGRRVGYDRVRKFVARHSRWTTVSPRDLDRAKRWFDRHGAKAVFLGRLIPGFRALISLPAGVERMNMPAFILYTSLGSAIWNAVLAGTGYILGAKFREVAQVLDPLSWFVVGGMAIWYGWRVVRAG